MQMSIHSLASRGWESGWRWDSDMILNSLTNLQEKLSQLIANWIFWTWGLRRMFGVVAGNLKHGVDSVSNTLRIFAREELNRDINLHAKIQI